MSKKKRARELRFGTGTGNDPFTPAWKIWSNRSDIYLATRQIGGDFKISLHPGWWGAAYTKQSGITVGDTDSRTARTWPVPPEEKPGWTRGPIIKIVRPFPEEDFDIPAH